MAQKKTYIYHVLIGRNDQPEIDQFMTARNSGVLIEYCKELYKDKKYNFYQAIKVGVSNNGEGTTIIQEPYASRLKNSSASKSDKYSEIETEAPKFITKEEAGNLL